MAAATAAADSAAADLAVADLEEVARAAATAAEVMVVAVRASGAY